MRTPSALRAHRVLPVLVFCLFPTHEPSCTCSVAGHQRLPLGPSVPLVLPSHTTSHSSMARLQKFHGATQLVFALEPLLHGQYYLAQLASWQNLQHLTFFLGTTVDSNKAPTPVILLEVSPRGSKPPALVEVQAFPGLFSYAGFYTFS